VALSLTSRSLDQLVIVVLTGRIVEGDEAATLDRQVSDLLLTHRGVVLDLHEVSFVDSAGLGVLVRLLSRVRGAGGDLVLCRVAPRIQKSLDVSRLHTVLVSYDSVDAAVTALRGSHAASDATEREAVDILCVHQSRDVLAFLHRVLQTAGYGLVSATNVADAATLLIATRPRVVVIDAQSRAIDMAGRFGTLVGNAHVIELPASFSTEDAGQASQRLLEDIARALNIVT